EHIYTTDFFQMSAFNPEHQIISIYYFAKALEPIKASIKTTPFDFDEAQMQLYSQSTQIESFRFIDWENFSADMITLPIDKIVAALLLKLY
ncbi:MAG: NUDIX hydrolase, partial [Ferruginibacter sp.]|nr:NUDIX hydrolase [Ferruginibacter sp.]